jgi:hypothetical protein
MPLQATSGAASYDAFGGGGKFVPSYIEEVFGTWLYTGTGASQTVTNGIDITGKGGLVWIKSRSGTTGHRLTDTIRGATKSLVSETTAGEATESTGLTAFGTTGFTIGADVDYNTSDAIYASWAFAKKTKFFDIQTWTGTGSNRTISHSLGSVPGCIMVKRTDTTGDWQVYHRSLANTEYLVLNSTAGKATGATRWNSTTATSSVFSLGTDATVNASAGTYVAYIFAHDAGGFGLTGTDNVVTCGTYVGTGSPLTITLGYEPQWVLIKTTGGNLEGWSILDNMRGMPVTGTTPYLFANSSVVENQTSNFNARVTATGFVVDASTSNEGLDYIYIAIRRGPMKVPTDATKVFAPVAYTGTSADNRLVDAGILTDMTMARIRTTTSTGGFYVADRLRANASLATTSTNSENTDLDSFMTPTVGYGSSFSAMNGFGVGNDTTRQLNQSSTSQLAYAFQRAPSFFDVVCYKGDSVSGRQVSHNLGVPPQLIIVKSRSTSTSYTGPVVGFGSDQSVLLNTAEAEGTQIGGYPQVLNVSSRKSYFVVLDSNGDETGSQDGVNYVTTTYVAYLFATCAGVSKVGSYTGTGTTLQVNCGFTGGARFVLIKRTDSTGAWHVWDTARGIVSGNDPYLLFNTTAAEVTNTDYIDTYSAGFEISSTAPAAINASGGSFIFLAIA